METVHRQIFTESRNSTRVRVNSTNILKDLNCRYCIIVAAVRKNVTFTYLNILSKQIPQQQLLIIQQKW